MKVLIGQGELRPGSRVMAAPAVLDQRDEDGIVVLINPEPDGALAADSRRAASVGPALAITVEE